MLRYSLLRLLVLVACFLGLYLAGMRGLWLVILAALTSAVISWFLLRGPRDQFAGQVEGRIAARERRLAQRRGVSDEEAEDTHESSGRSPTQTDGRAGSKGTRTEPGATQAQRRKKSPQSRESQGRPSSVEPDEYV